MAIFIDHGQRYVHINGIDKSFTGVETKSVYLVAWSERLPNLFAVSVLNVCLSEVIIVDNDPGNVSFSAFAPLASLGTGFKKRKHFIGKINWT